MQFTVQTGEFLKEATMALECASTNPKSEHDDAPYINIIATQNGISFESNNGWVALKTDIKNIDTLKVIQDGTATVDAASLRSILSSFPRHLDLSISVEGTNLVLKSLSDTDEFQTIPLGPKPVDIPVMADKFNTSVKINRLALIEAMNKILFTIGVEKGRLEFFYWKVKLEKEYLRAVCGDGICFAVYEASGKNLTDATDSTLFYIFKQHNPMLEKIIKAINSDFVTFNIYTNNNSDDGSLMNQIVVEVDGMKTILIGHDPGIKFPNEDKFLSRKNTHKFATNMSDWKLPLNGIMATYDDAMKTEGYKHYIGLKFDINKKQIICNSDHSMKSNRKIKMLDFSVDNSSEEEINYLTLSRYIKSLEQKGANEVVQMEFTGSKSPIVVKFFGSDKINDDVFRVNSIGLKEQYTVFFGPYIKN